MQVRAFERYIPLRGGDMNGFWDIKPFTNWMGCGMPGQARGDFLV